MLPMAGFLVGLPETCCGSFLSGWNSADFIRSTASGLGCFISSPGRGALGLLTIGLLAETPHQTRSCFCYGRELEFNRQKVLRPLDVLNEKKNTHVVRCGVRWACLRYIFCSGEGLDRYKPHAMTPTKGLVPSFNTRREFGAWHVQCCQTAKKGSSLRTLSQQPARQRGPEVGLVSLPNPSMPHTHFQNQQVSTLTPIKD